MPYISQYNRKDIAFLSHQKDWKKLEQISKTIALNILFVPHNTKLIRLTYKSKYNHKRKNQVILLMITDCKKWHYLAVKSLSALLRGIFRVAAHNICNLRYKVLKEIPVVFHNGSTLSAPIKKNMVMVK